MLLNSIWFWLLGFLFVGYALLDGFDLGVGIIHLFTRDPEQRELHFNAVKPVWDGNEVWLITAGAGMFAAFPVVYAAVFSGFYLAFLLLLACLIFRAVSIEFVAKVESAKWRNFWDWSFGISSLVISLLVGVAFGNVLRGIPVSQDGYSTVTFLSLLNPYALLIGLMVVAMFVMHGAAWMAPKSDGLIQARFRLWTLGGWGGFLLFYGIASMLTYAFHRDLMLKAYSRPMVWVFLALLLLAALSLPLWIRLRKDATAFGASALIIGAASGLAGLGLYPVLLPSTTAHDYSLTIQNASSSHLTLQTMLIIVLIGMPFVLGYTIVVHYIFRGKVEAKGETLY